MSNRAAELDKRSIVNYSIHMATIFIHNEYWDHRTGREIVLQAAKAAERCYTPESVHIYTPSALDTRGDEWGECSIWWSVHIPDSTYMTGLLYEITDAIRSAGIRVKDAGILEDEYARCSFDALMDHIYSPFVEEISR